MNTSKFEDFSSENRTDSVKNSIKLVDYGEFSHPFGIQVISFESAQKMAKNFNRLFQKLARRFHGVPIYIGHPDDPHFQGSSGHGDSRAYGWVSAIDARSNGIWINVKWSRAGRELVENAHYKFLSPRWEMEPLGENRYSPVNLISVGLTNNPNIPVEAISNQLSHCASLKNDAVKCETCENVDEMLVCARFDENIELQQELPYQESTVDKIDQLGTKNNSTICSTSLNINDGNLPQEKQQIDHDRKDDLVESARSCIMESSCEKDENKEIYNSRNDEGCENPGDNFTGKKGIPLATEDSELSSVEDREKSENIADENGRKIAKISSTKNPSDEKIGNEKLPNENWSISLNRKSLAASLQGCFFEIETEKSQRKKLLSLVNARMAAQGESFTDAWQNLKTEKPALFDFITFSTEKTRN